MFETSHTNRITSFESFLHSCYASQDLFQVNHSLTVPVVDDVDKPLEEYLSILPRDSFTQMGESEEGAVDPLINFCEDELLRIFRDPMTMDMDTASNPFNDPNFKQETEIFPSSEIVVPKSLSPLEQEAITDEEKKQSERKKTNSVQKRKPKPPKRQKTRRRKIVPGKQQRPNRSIHLWEFLRELLNSGTSSYIQWISKKDGIFRLVNSGAVARLWGERKNRKNMTYEKMSRALRYYYEKEILERVPNARLIYKFGSRTKSQILDSNEESLSDSSEV